MPRMTLDQVFEDDARSDSPMLKETITLQNIEGFAHKSGTDKQGNKWVEFEVDYLAEQLPGECTICEAKIESGWMCLDGGEEVCHHHVEFVTDS